MGSGLATTTYAVALLATLLPAALGDVQRPTQGYQIGNLSLGYDIIFPLSIAQCEPVLIYYNNSASDAGSVELYTPNFDIDLLDILLPAFSIGYLDWICNIPTGYSFVAAGYGDGYQYYVVQPGSSSACLHNVSTTYSYADYNTIYFQSYIQDSTSDYSLTTSYQRPTIDFPTSSLTTITANPNLAINSTTPTLPVSSTLSSTTTEVPQVSSASRHQPNKAVIAGGVTGGFFLVLLTLTIIFVFLRKRRKSYSDVAQVSPLPYSGLMMSQPGSTHLESIDALHGRSGPTPHVNPTTEPGTRWRKYVRVATPPAAGARTSHPAVTESKFSPSAPVVPLAPIPEPSTSETRNVNVAPRAPPTASQSQPLMTSVDDSSAHPPETPSPDVQTSIMIPLPQLSNANEVWNDDSDLATVLGDVLRTRLSERERQALATNLLTPGHPGPSRGDTMSPPPPYSG